jgi:O-antigen/teichoic acid export membrane protein
MWRAGIFVRMLGSAVIAQGLLSAGNLFVGLIFIRRTTDHDYGSYVLVLNALMLITQVMTQFTTPAMVLRMSGASSTDRSDLIGGLYRELRRLLPILGAAGLTVAVLLWATGTVSLATCLLIATATAAALAALHREFFRMVLLAYRRPLDVLKVDVLYVAVLLGGAMIATLTPMPALVAVAFLCVAAAMGSALLSRALWRHEPWNLRGSPGILREIAAIGTWTTAGSAIHWSFTQGYNYLIVGTLNVKAVAAVAATRLLMMPINMLSTGVGSLMLPTTSNWLREHAPRTIFLRLLLLCVGLAGVAGCYFGVLWELRDWIFLNILKKEFAQRDLLMQLWFVVFVLMVFRDQLLFLPLASGRYRVLTGLTLLSAVVSLTVSYLSMIEMGVTGALIGIMTGEIISVVGLIVLSVLELKKAGQLRAPAFSPSPGDT